MRIILEDFTPNDESLRWRIHDAYFAERGVAAWQQGDIPHYSTNNYAVARQHARMFAASVRQLCEQGVIGPDDTVNVLEVGAGLGAFAWRFLDALRDYEAEAQAPGLRLFERVRYILSDYSMRSLREAAATNDLLPYISAGKILPARFDMREPGKLVDWQDQPVEGQIALAIANYVCCVSPTKVLRHDHEGGWRELFVKLAVEVDGADDAEAPAPDALLARYLERPTDADVMKGIESELSFRPIDLTEALPGPVHGRLLESLTEPGRTVSIPYAYTFLDMLVGVRERMLPQGLWLISDFGTCDRRSLRGVTDHHPQHYGNTLSYGVSFAVFEALCATQGYGYLGTRNLLRAVHMCGLTYEPARAAQLEGAFTEAFVEREDGEDVLDFAAAAKAYAMAEDHARAARMYQRCLTLLPDSAETHYRLGEACLNAKQNLAAVDYLEAGRALDDQRGFDFDFLLGRAYYRLERYEDALRVYQASLARGEDSATHANIAMSFQQLGQFKPAYLGYKRALELNPEFEGAQSLLDALKTKWIESIIAAEASGAAEGSGAAEDVGAADS